MRQRSFYLFLIIIAALMALLNVYLWQLQDDKKSKIRELSEQVSYFNTQNERLKARNKTLDLDLQTLQSPDSFYTYEEKAREEYGMIGQDETFFVLPQEELNALPDLAALQEYDREGLAPIYAVSPQTPQPSPSEPEPISPPIEMPKIDALPLELESLEGN